MAIGSRADSDAIFLARCAFVWLVVFVIFRHLPSLDIGFTALVCENAGRSGGLICDAFPARASAVASGFRTLFYWAPIAALAALITDMAASAVRDGWSNRRYLRERAVLIGGFLLGPILLVNGLLKALSGRPRPHETIDFGGSLPFMAAGDFSGACTANCSFVSGEAASAGWLLCLLPLLRGPLRPIIAAVIIDVSVATPLLRVAMGGHYASDAVLGWIIGLASPAAVSLLIFLKPVRFSATLDQAR